MRSASAALLLALGCEGGCFGTPPIAHLREAVGMVERDHESAWATAQIGDRFILGDAIKTATRARAAVEFEAGGGLAIEERTLVRFLERPDAEAGFAVAFGDAQLGGGGVQFGLATIDPRSEIEVRRDGK